METPQFIATAVRGEAADCRVRISEFPPIYWAVGKGLRAKGLPAERAVDMLWLNLCGVCPSCGGVLFGSDLGNLASISVDAEEVGWERIRAVGTGEALGLVASISVDAKEIGWDVIYAGGPPGALRFCRQGLCVNQGCSSPEIVLSWWPRYEWFEQTRDIEGLSTILQTDAHWFARRRAAQALGHLGGPQVVQPLMRALEDDNEDVRGNAAIALGRVGDKRAVDSLRALLEREEYRAVREDAEEALDKIGRE